MDGWMRCLHIPSGHPTTRHHRTMARSYVCWLTERQCMVDHALVCHLAESSIDGLACVRHLSLEGHDSVFKFLCLIVKYMRVVTLARVCFHWEQSELEVRGFMCTLADDSCTRNLPSAVHIATLPTNKGHTHSKSLRSTTRSLTDLLAGSCGGPTGTGP